jgi:hypothetical protein
MSFPLNSCRASLGKTFPSSACRVPSSSSVIPCAPAPLAAYGCHGCLLNRLRDNKNIIDDLLDELCDIIYR